MVRGALVAAVVVKACLVPCGALVELCCDVDSELGSRAASFGVKSLRITQSDRFDLPRGVDKACRFLRGQTGADAWAALPCIAWCIWQFINQKKLGVAFCARLGWRRRQSIRMIGGVDKCFAAASAGGGGCYSEWPRICLGCRFATIP